MNPELNTKILMKNYDKRIVRKLNDMRDKFKDADNIKNNPTIYNVYIKDFGAFQAAITVLESGEINKEFFMTKGHKHKKPSEEIYILLNGKGKLYFQGTKAKIIEMKKDKIYVIQKSYGHRVINTGNKKIELLSVYSKNTGHDYKFKFKKRVFKR